MASIKLRDGWVSDRIVGAAKLANGEFLGIVGAECGDQRNAMGGDSVPMGGGRRRRAARGAMIGAEIGGVGCGCGEAGGPMPIMEEWEVSGAGGMK